MDQDQTVPVLFVEEFFFKTVQHTTKQTTFVVFVVLRINFYFPAGQAVKF